MEERLVEHYLQKYLHQLVLEGVQLHPSSTMMCIFGLWKLLEVVYISQDRRVCLILCVTWSLETFERDVLYDERIGTDLDLSFDMIYKVLKRVSPVPLGR